VHEGSSCPQRSLDQRDLSDDDGMRLGWPSPIIWLGTLHATTASAARPPRLHAGSAPPTIDLYRKNVFSTRAGWWYPEAFFQLRRPRVFTLVMVRSRTPDLGPRPDTFAVFAGGTTTRAPRR